MALTIMAKHNQDEEFELIEGDEINISKKTVAVALGFGLFFLLMGLGLGVPSILMLAGVIKEQKSPHPALLCLLAFTGICFLVGGGIFTYKGAYILLFGERYVLGDDALQWVRGSTVKLHLPYDNMEEIVLEKFQEQSADNVYTVTILAIDILDLRRSDTRVERSQRKQFQSKYGHDLVIADVCEISLKKFLGKLRKKWRTNTGP